MTGGSGIGQSMVQCYPGRCFWGAQVKRRQEQAADNRQQAANNRQQTAGTVGRQQRRSKRWVARREWNFDNAMARDRRGQYQLPDQRNKLANSQ